TASGGRSQRRWGRADDRAGDVPLGVAALTAELHRLLETEQGEDDAAGRDRLHDDLGRVRPLEEESALGSEVAEVEVSGDEHHDGEDRDEDLDAGDPGVGPREPLDAHQVDRKSTRLNSS